MQRYRVFIILMVAIDVILVCICGYFYVTKDRKAPKISFAENDTIYSENTTNDQLMKGVGATDNRDGDLSSRIVIEKILDNNDSDTVVVYYAVCDYDGNVAKASRVFYKNAQNNIDELIRSTSEGANEVPDNSISSEASYGNEESVIGEAEENANVQDDEAELEDGEEDDEYDGTKSEAEANEKSEEVDIAEGNAESTGETDSKVDESVKQETKDKTENVKNDDSVESKVEEGSPYIELSYNEYRIKKGNSVPWQEVIRTLRDDVQDYNYLFDKLVASEYDRNKEGVYPVTLYTMDAQNNKSNVVKVNIIVE